MASKTIQASTRLYQNAFSNYHILENNKTGVNRLLQIASGGTFIDFFKNLFNKPLDSIASLRLFPLTTQKFVTELVPDNNITIGNTSYPCKNFDLSKVQNNVKRYLVGRYNYTAGSFIDLLPYTQIQVYLPYIGFADVSPNEINNCQMRIYYTIDIPTGIATASIVRVPSGSSDETVIATKSAKIAVDIPFGSNNKQDNIRNIINTIVSTGISVAVAGASGSPVAGAIALGTVARGSLSVLNSLQVKYERGGTANTQTNLMMPSHPYVIINRVKPVAVNELDFAHIYGKPLYKSRVLSTLTGFTVVEDLHLEHLPYATSVEMDEIERLLKSGVHL